MREAAQGEEVLAMVVVVEEGQGCVEEVPVQGEEVQVLEEEQVLEGPVGGCFFIWSVSFVLYVCMFRDLFCKNHCSRFVFLSPLRCWRSSEI